MTAPNGDQPRAAIGQSLRRREDRRLLTGQGRYVADLAPPGTVDVVFRRAGLPSARVVRVDTSAAAAAPGVLGVWTAADLPVADVFMPDTMPEPPRRRPVLAGDVVGCPGDAIVAVAAASAYQAADAADLVEVELEAIPPEPFQVDTEHGFGEPREVPDGARVAVSAELGLAVIAGAAMEPRACLATWDEATETLEIRATVGWVHGLRDHVAHCLGLPKEKVIALTEDVGGSFGAKNQPYPEYVAVAAIARALRRPARWVAGRTEDGLTTAHAHGATLHLELSADHEGRLAGLRGRIDWPVGAYVTRGASMSYGYASHLVSAYRLPALELDVSGHVHPSQPASFIRGGGRPVGNYGIERMMDRLARALAIDPVELRRRNLVGPGDMPHATGFPGQVYDGGDYERLLDLATERAGYREVRERQRAGEPVGLGVAMCVESTGIGAPEPSRVVVEPGGTAHVYAGSTPQGQGHETFLAQVVADRLGWPADRVVVHVGDSRNVAFSMVTAGSRSAVEVGNSVALSGAEARRQLLERAAERLEAAPEDLVAGPEGVAVRGAPGRSIALAEVVGQGLEAAATWNSNGAPAWASSCHVAVVRVDVETGGVDMLRYVLAHDSGRAINPLLMEGQLHGGYAHGLGYALFEEAVFAGDGSLLTPSFLDYTVVSAPELRTEPELIHTETPTTHNPEGFRGVGEAGTIAVPAAIANAVEDAVRAAGYDVEVGRVPVTPQYLYSLLHAGAAAARS